MTDRRSWSRCHYDDQDDEVVVVEDDFDADAACDVSDVL